MQNEHYGNVEFDQHSKHSKMISRIAKKQPAEANTNFNVNANVNLIEPKYDPDIFENSIHKEGYGQLSMNFNEGHGPVGPVSPRENKRIVSVKAEVKVDQNLYTDIHNKEKSKTHP